jgi:hypothetical protein
MIDRAPFNLLQDDDGSNLVGSIWNKAAIKTVLLDPIDAALPPKIITTTDSGVLHNWAPTGFGAWPMLIHWTGTVEAKITGFPAGFDGQVVTLQNAGTAPMTLWHLDSGSAAGNKLRNSVTLTPTPIGISGYAQYVYRTVVGAWMLLAHEQGSWITPPYSAANYFSNSAGLTWTVEPGDVAQCNYRLAGKTLAWNLHVYGTQITGTPGTWLNARIPGGFTVTAQFAGWCNAFQGSTIGGTYELGGTAIGFLRDSSGTAWPVGSMQIKANGLTEVT